MSEQKTKLSTPSNYGRIAIENDDLDAVRFWLRVFSLEPYVDVASADIRAKPEVKRASVPIISEHRSGQLYWYYAILLYIDPLGLSGGIGIIYFADEAHRAEAEKARNEVGDHIMQTIQGQVEKGKMTGTMLTIEPTKESEISSKEEREPRRRE
jgi:hypothetical protein